MDEYVFFVCDPSRSAEQLLAVEAAEVRRKNSRRNDLTGRASTGAKGAWGSISRVFARNKHRRTLDSSLYNGKNLEEKRKHSELESVKQVFSSREIKFTWFSYKNSNFI